MFKAFTVGLAGIIFSTTLGIFAATTAVNASAPVQVETETASYQ